MSQGGNSRNGNGGGGGGSGVLTLSDETTIVSPNVSGNISILSTENQITVTSQPISNSLVLSIPGTFITPGTAQITGDFTSSAFSKFEGGISYGIVQVSGTYDTIGTESNIACSTQLIPTVINLLTLPSGRDGYFIIIYDGGGNASVNNITINSTGGQHILIPGSGPDTSITISQNFGYVILQDAEQNWQVIGQSNTTIPVGPLVINRQVFETSNTYTPTSRLSYAIVELVGGGGAGAGCDINNVNSLFVCSGTGGGSGGYCNKALSAATIGASQVITIGNGGIGLTASGTAPNGGTTSFGSILTADGGFGGSSQSPNYSTNISSGGIGGNATGGDYVIFGQDGGPCIGFSLTSPSPLAFYLMSQSGPGGSNPLGFGGNTVSTLDEGQTSIRGINGKGYGSGASSASSCYNISDTGAPGGNGANGVVIITEFISSGTISPQISWVVTTSNTSMLINTGYISNSAGVLNLTLPSIASVGSTIEVCGVNGGWLIAQNAGQSIVFGNQTSTIGITGSISSELPTDCLRMVCTVANTTFEVLSSQGNLTVT